MIDVPAAMLAGALLGFAPALSWQSCDNHAQMAMRDLVAQARQGTYYGSAKFAGIEVLESTITIGRAIDDLNHRLCALEHKGN